MQSCDNEYLLIAGHRGVGRSSRGGGLRLWGRKVEDGVSKVN